MLYEEYLNKIQNSVKDMKGTLDIFTFLQKRLETMRKNKKELSIKLMADNVNGRKLDTEMTSLKPEGPEPFLAALPRLQRGGHQPDGHPPEFIQGDAS